MTRALIFDSYFDDCRGVVLYVRIFEGEITKNAGLRQTDFGNGRLVKTDESMEKMAFNGLYVVHKTLIQKKSKKGVDMGVKVRYNGGSLSKSAFPTSTKRNEKRGNL